MSSLVEPPSPATRCKIGISVFAFRNLPG